MLGFPSPPFFRRHRTQASGEVRAQGADPGKAQRPLWGRHPSSQGSQSPPQAPCLLSFPSLGQKLQQQSSRSSSSRINPLRSLSSPSPSGYQPVDACRGWRSKKGSRVAPRTTDNPKAG